MTECDTSIIIIENINVMLTNSSTHGVVKLIYLYQIHYCFQNESRLNTPFHMDVVYPYLEVQKGVKVKNAQTVCQMMGLPPGYWSPSQATWYPACHHWQWHPVVSLALLG